jgi:uncharacterized protein (UPF0335 family)
MAEKITMETLAKMIHEGFKNTATKEDLNRVKEDVNRVEQTQKDMLEELTATHADVRYLRSSVDILTRNEAERDALVKGLVARVHRLEQKAGLAK